MGVHSLFIVTMHKRKQKWLQSTLKVLVAIVSIYRMMHWSNTGGNCLTEARIGKEIEYLLKGNGWWLYIVEHKRWGYSWHGSAFLQPPPPQ